jgi:hypothetical protein
LEKEYSRSEAVRGTSAARNLYVTLTREKRLDVDDWRAVDDLDGTDL